MPATHADHKPVAGEVLPAPADPFGFTLEGRLDLPPDLRAQIERTDPRLWAAVEAADAYAVRARADSTRRNYHSAWTAFKAWCEALDVTPLPVDPRVLAVYLAHLSLEGGHSGTGRRPGTIVNAMAAISAVHRDQGCTDPSKHPGVVRMMRGLKRTLGTHRRQRTALTAELLVTVVDAISTPAHQQIRDRLLLALTEVGLTPNQIVQLDTNDVACDGEVVRIVVPASGRKGSRDDLRVLRDGGPLCVVDALSTWLPMLSRSGPLVPCTDRAGQLTHDRWTRQAVTAALARLAALAGVDTPRGRTPQWSSAARVEAARQVQTGLSVADLRDRALLCAGWHLAARRSNLSMLRWEELERTAVGYTVRFRASKTDQEGQGRLLALAAKPGSAACPVAALDSYAEAVRSMPGYDPSWPVFLEVSPRGTSLQPPRDRSRRLPGGRMVTEAVGLTPQGIHAAVIRRCKQAGLLTDSAGVPYLWGSHSLRRGWITEAARQGIGLTELMAHSGHVTPAVAVEYIEAAKLYSGDTAAARLAMPA